MINSTLSIEGKKKLEREFFFPKTPMENKGLFVFVLGLQGSWKLKRDCLSKNIVIGQGVMNTKLKEGKFMLDTKKKFFTLRVDRNWNKLSSVSEQVIFISKAVYVAVEENVGT